MIVCIDVDGVIADISTEMCYRYGMAGIEVNLDDIKVFKYEDALGEPYKGFIRDQFDDPTFWLNALPYEDAWNVLNKWGDDGHDIHLVTARWDREVTEEWLDMWDIPYTELHNGMAKGDKHKHVKEIGGVFMVEDRPEEVAALSDAEIVTFCVSRPYNQMVEESQYVFTVNNFYDIDAMAFGDK